MAGTRTRLRAIPRALFVPVLVLVGALSAAPPALGLSTGGLIVVPHPASAQGLSYFKVSTQPGSAARAGAIELRNPTSRSMRVALSAVAGETLSTLGSSYAQPGSRAQGAAQWLRLGTRAVTLTPGESIAVPVAVEVPRGAQPGDYLSGVSIESLDQHTAVVKRHGASIASVSRYAIGTEVSLPGPRHPSIQFTGARLRREPSGLTFLLLARNGGNVILQKVHGWVRIERGGRLVLSRAIEAGTFVAHTAISYPVNAFRETASEGTRYRITAWLRYQGGIARLDTGVTFGHRAAAAQQRYGGPSAASAGASGLAWWKIAGIAAVLAYALITTALLLARKRRDTAQPTRG